MACANAGLGGLLNADPHHALDWLEDIEFDLRADAEPRKRSENITSDQLLEVGETLLREAEDASHLSPQDRAVLARNGLMLALLAVHPIRHKNFARLTLSKSFQKMDERWWIILEAADTKGRRADERQVPEYLTPLVDRYLATFRPILIAQKASETRKIEEAAIASDDQPAGPLWVSRMGDPLPILASAQRSLRPMKPSLGNVSVLMLFAERLRPL